MKIAVIEKVGFVGQCQASPAGYASSLESRYSTPTAVRVAEHALRELEAARAKDVAAHERNVPLLETNKAIHARVEALMDEVGMPRKYTAVDTKSRSRFPKKLTHGAGYQADLIRECRTDDGFEAATRVYERLLKEYQSYAARAAGEAEQAKVQAERSRQAEIEKRRADMALAAVLLRYELPIESSWRDVLDNLRSRHQRLNLAVAMQQTRADWNEGAWRVRDALNAFQIETTEDKDIANDVLSGLEDFSDGRVFRDMRWNYGALFASVPDRQLTADVQAALGQVDA